MKVYKCPNGFCGYRILEAELKQARFDFNCPKCRQSYLSQFELDPIWSRRQNGEKETTKE